MLGHCPIFEIVPNTLPVNKGSVEGKDEESTMGSEGQVQSKDMASRWGPT